MSYYAGTNIPIGLGSCHRMNTLIDEYLTPRILAFRQICFFDLPLRLCPDGETWKAPFGNWLDGGGEGGNCYEANKNGAPLLLSDMTDVNLANGSFKLASGTELGPDNRPRDVVEATFEFDYFPTNILEGLLNQSLQNINTSAVGTPTSYSICSNPPPDYWDGVIVDMAFAMCMEKLLLDYSLWKYKLIFAIGPNEIESGGGDAASQIETLKRNSEERAYKTIENEKFKMGRHYVSPPTIAYFDSIRGIGSSGGRHGIPFTGGRLRGWRPNKYI